jgi:hypothetical protein
MTLEALVQEIKALPIEQRKQLVMAIFDSLTEAPAAPAAPTLGTRELRAAVEQLGKTDTPASDDELRPAWIKRS